MGDTFNAFVKFISDDPIMLGLCIAIIVLIIAFILVLFLGRKKDDKEENVDNTRELLKTEINMDALKSTQEYSISELQTGESSSSLSVTEENAENQETPVIEEFKDSSLEVPAATEVPVTLETEATPLDIPASPVENTQVTNTDIPSFDSLKIENEAPTSNVTVEEQKPSTIYDENIFDIGSTPTVETPTIDNEAQENSFDITAMPQIVESEINPLEPTDMTIPTIESVFKTPTVDATTPNKTEPTDLPNMSEPVKETPILEAPFSSVNVDANAELPTINTDDFSRTDIIKHIPVFETSTQFAEPIAENTTDDDDLDDIDLPMLNTATPKEPEENKSTLSSLQGETFNIN